MLRIDLQRSEPTGGFVPPVIWQVWDVQGNVVIDGAALPASSITYWGPSQINVNLAGLPAVHGREPLGSRDRGRHGKCPVLAYRRAAVKRGEASLHFTFTFTLVLVVPLRGTRKTALFFY